MISLKDLSIEIKGNLILENVNASFKEENIYCIKGENGSGKTILLKAIIGFIPPYVGSVEINGEDIYKKNIFAPDCRAVLEKPNFIKDLTGYENIKLLTEINNKVKDDEIDNWFEKFDLLQFKNDKVKTYSLGMLQKLALVQAFVESPQIIALDEPFNGLDKDSVVKLKDILKQEKLKGKIIIITSHIEDSDKDLYDNIYIIEDYNLK